MKKYYYLPIIVIFALVIAFPAMTRAVDGTDDSVGGVDASVQTNTTVGTPVPPPLAPRPGILQQIRAKVTNVQNNEDDRNNRLMELEKRTKMASGTRPLIKDIRNDRREESKDIREQGREDMKDASSTKERRDIRKDMRKDIFEVRKQALIKELGVALRNLKQIRDRIASRIDKAVTEGRNMTEAKKLLVVADGKIVLAEQAISALSAFTPTASSTVTASSTIDLGKPREVGDAAIKAVKTAHEALVAVVRAIAHAMGLGNGTSTPSIIPLPPTATTTPTSTPAVQESIKSTNTNDQ